jgi:hypothetical protein
VIRRSETKKGRRERIIRKEKKIREKFECKSTNFVVYCCHGKISPLVVRSCITLQHPLH